MGDRKRTPEEVLAVLAKHIDVEMDIYLERPTSGVPHHEVHHNVSAALNHAVGLAVMGMRTEAERLLAWCDDAAPAALEGRDWSTWAACGDLVTARWLRTGHLDPALVLASADTYMHNGSDDDPGVRVEQVLRLLEAGRLDEAKAQLETVVRRDSPVLFSGARLTPIRVAQFGIQFAEGRPLPPESEKLLSEFLARKRRKDFSQGLFSYIVIWMRLYGRLFAPDMDPWSLLGLLRGEFSVPSSRS